MQPNSQWPGVWKHVYVLVCECTHRQVWVHSDNSRKQTNIWDREGRELLVPNNLSVQTSSSARQILFLSVTRRKPEITSWALVHCFMISPQLNCVKLCFFPPFQSSSPLFLFLSLSYPFLHRDLVVVADWVFSQEVKLHHVLLVIHLGVKLDMFHPQRAAAHGVGSLTFLLFVPCPQG